MRAKGSKVGRTWSYSENVLNLRRISFLCLYINLITPCQILIFFANLGISIQYWANYIAEKHVRAKVGERSAKYHVLKFLHDLEKKMVHSILQASKINK